MATFSSAITLSGTQSSVTITTGSAITTTLYEMNETSDVNRIAIIAISHAETATSGSAGTSPSIAIQKFDNSNSVWRTLHSFIVGVANPTPTIPTPINYATSEYPNHLKSGRIAGDFANYNSQSPDNTYSVLPFKLFSGERVVFTTGGISSSGAFKIAVHAIKYLPGN